jgi:hypothetical protein
VPVAAVGSGTETGAACIRRIDHGKGHDLHRVRSGGGLTAIGQLGGDSGDDIALSRRTDSVSARIVDVEIEIIRAARPD